MYADDFKVIDAAAINNFKKKRFSEAQANRNYLKIQHKQLELLKYETEKQKRTRESTIKPEVFQKTKKHLELMLNKIKPGLKATSEQVIEFINKKQQYNLTRKKEYFDNETRNFMMPDYHQKTYFKGANELMLGQRTSLNITDFQMVKKLDLPDKSDLLKDLKDEDDDKYDFSQYNGVDPRVFTRAVLEQCQDIRPKDYEVVQTKSNLNVRRQRNKDMMLALAPSIYNQESTGISSPVKLVQPAVTSRDFCKCQ